ncbi:MAG TPA: polynucleotide adenylyltransferase PcnB [Burkholderiaceae bacterium]|nr:polynucleotide adenylyltransferase PcnB [Burkholderiaceae bacterium]
MIKSLIDKLLGKPARIPLGRRVDVPASEHGIDHSLVDEHAIRVVSTLKQAGHEAYIVGGAVRDLLVGRRPKDFDVATNATPEQVKSLFRRAFVIGRRFRLVHVVFGRGREHEVIEVSTFRAYRDASEADTVAGNERTSKAELAGKTHVVDASGRVLRDNVWGPQIEDAARRDFTVNAMYYDPETRIVVDFHHGIADAKRRLLRMIGDPATRYREDPVRLVRVVRFAAKLGFTIEKKTAAAMAEAVPLLANVPASRLFDEMIKLLQTGHALASIEALKAHGLHRGVFPVLDAVFDGQHSSPQRMRFVELALADTDRRVAEGRAVAPSFLLACLLWHDVQSRWQQLRQRGEHPMPALQQAVDAVFEARIGDVSGRGRLAADMREIWMMQPRFERRQANTASALVAQPRFRAGYDFLRLRADAQEADGELADWWEDFSLGDPDEREALLQVAREADRSRRQQPEATAAPAKRRRRRRRSSGARSEGGAASEPAASSS